MWIAKPLHALSSSEREAWSRAVRARLTRDPETPLAQSLAWARAIAAARMPCYLVFSPADGVGGVVFAAPRPGHPGAHYECVNGPLLDWDDPARAPAQLAVFATAVSRLPDFASLSARPRWTVDATAARLKALPIPAQGFSDASTLVIPLAGSDREQFEAFSPRLRRTLRRTQALAAESQWDEVAGIEGLGDFLEPMRAFGRDRGFYVPSREWFEGLLGAAADEGLRFWLSRAAVGEGAERAGASLLVVMFGSRAHYLFGFEERGPEAPSGASPAALAQFRAMRECAALGAREYDLNGYLEDPDPSHPYAGVREFKRQFGGSVVRYRVPEFAITP